MNPHVASSPVSLRYVAALRGIRPLRAGETFAYLDANCLQPDLLTCLAASNPEGQFYGLIADEPACKQAQTQAPMRGVLNLTFLCETPRGVVQKLEGNPGFLPQLDYMHCDEGGHALAADARAAVFDLAEKQLKPAGLFNYIYSAYAGDDGHLRFLVRELAPEMNADQARVFLHELKKLGHSYLARNPDVAARLDQAIARDMPDAFFAAYADGEARSGTFDTLVALRSRGFAYAGDSAIAANYVELSVPPEAQPLIVAFRDNHLYEALKDLTLDRPIRSDIWCRMPVAQIGDLADLFGGFSYGITTPRADVPSAVKVQGKTIDLSSPLYIKLIDLMTLMPASIGDFLAYPGNEDFAPSDVVGAVQILIACGLACPMRGLYQAGAVANDVAQPRLAGAFNRSLDKTQVTDTEIWMASPVLGAAVALSPREVLVMQALNRAGLVDSVSALLPELERLAKNPSQAAHVMNTAEPTAEVAHNMIQDVVGKSIVQWYAYGLLEAA